MNAGKLTAVVLAILALLLGACGASTPAATPTPEVLADCFLSFQVSAWEDLDGNGVWDAPEPPLAGVAFRLDGRFAQITSGRPFLSDAEGKLRIGTWSPGSCVEQAYTISTIPAEPYEPTTPATVTFTLAANESSYEGQFGFRAGTK